MNPRLVLVSTLTCALAPSVLALHPGARADDLGAEPNDVGKVTNIRKGVKELDLGGIFVLSHNQSGDAEASTRIASLGGAAFQYFLNNNLSAGVSLLASYDRVSSTTYSTSFGGSLFGTLHLRLGLGAFLRPTFGLGMLVGDLNTEVAPGMITRASQVALLARLGLPFAYFPSKRIVLQAGPELNVSLGNATPDGGEAQTFTSIAGGFGVSAGYAF